MTSELMVDISDWVVGYGGRPILNGISFQLKRGEILTLLGHNGAGKSTLLKSIFGVVDRQKGDIKLDGKKVNSLSPRFLVENGVAFVPEGRGVFPSLTVAEIMRLAARGAGLAKSTLDGRIEKICSILPELKKFYYKRAGSLSGGQQQMVSIGRALLADPKCLLLDEPSIGLAPKLFQDLLAPIKELQLKTNMSILLVEQNVKEALKISDRVVVMKSGSIILNGLPSELDDDRKLMELY